MECPVCGNYAQDITKADFDGIVVRCSQCRDYEIAGGDLEKLIALDIEDRVGVLQKAMRFAAPGTRPAISGTCF